MPALFKKQLSFSICLSIFLLENLPVIAQNGPLPIPYQRQVYLEFNKENSRIDKKTHSAFKPYLLDEQPNNWPLSGIKRMPVKTKLSRKIFNDNLVQFEDSTKKWSLTVNPILDLELGNESVSGIKPFTNTRGAQIVGTVGTKFSFNTSIFESQSRFAPYLESFVILNDVVPGQGLPKQGAAPIYDYTNVYGSISYNPSKFLNIQFGNDKIFIGDGYRSLLLSDVSFAYPHLKLNAKLGPFRYHYILSQYTDLRSDMTSPILGKPSKYSTIGYLDWAVSNKLNIGLFQAVIWVLQDSSGRKRPMRWNYLNPIVYLEPLETSTSSEGNVLTGLNLRYKINSSYSVYGQFALDEFIIKELRAGNGFFGNKFATQIGFQAVEPAHIKNLHLQSELNIVRPYTYSHWSSLTNYAQYNQPLAHPSGANFWEWVGLADYRFNRFYGSLKINLSEVGLDVDGKSWGQNIYANFFRRVNDYGNFIAQGLKTNIKIYELQAGFILNPSTNMRIFASYLKRDYTNSRTSNKTNMLSIGISTQLRNNYYDF